MDRTDLVAQAVRLALATGMAGLACIAPAFAQDNQNDVAVQEKVVVTGSRIKRADYEGALPVTVIDREEIDASGEISLAELLRTQTFNSFGSAKQRSGSEHYHGSVNTVSMRGLGPSYTLVLVNGRRIASAPTYSSSVQNLSMIPLAAVERIEVLRDGASAIYGTDALAGVINIILRRDYSGLHLSYEIGRPDDPGGDEDSYSITGGISGSKGNVTFGMNVQQQDIVYWRDRPFTSTDTGASSKFGFPGSYSAYITADDSRNPTGELIKADVFPDPRCPSELGADPDFPNSTEVPIWWGGGMCRYAYWNLGAVEAANDTKSFFLDTRYDVTDETEFFTRGMFTYNEVTGQFPPSPVWQLAMARDAPQNPTNPAHPTNYRGEPFAGQSVALDTNEDGEPDTLVEGPFDLSILFRNEPAGTRDQDWDDVLLDYVAGMRGTVNWLGGADWEISAQWSEQTSDLTASGEVLYAPLQAAIDAGELDLFGVFGPYDDDFYDSLLAARATRTGDARYRTTGGDAQLNFDAFHLPDGPVPVALGIEYRDEDYDIGFDEQSSSGAFGGDNVAFPNMSAARVVKSIFAETVIPALPGLELGLAARYDDYNDFGTTVNPKVNIAFRPIDSLLLRGSYGTGFKAPDLEQVYQPPSAAPGGFIDSWQCSQTDADTDGNGRTDVNPDLLPDTHPCRYQSFHPMTFSGNRDLEPEESDNWTAGLVWSPNPNFSIIVDYYKIKMDEQIWNEEDQALLDEELRRRQVGEAGQRVGDVVRTSSGQIVTVFSTYENVDRLETDGIDTEASFQFSIGQLGDVSTTLRWTHVLNYDKDYNDGRGTIDWVGKVGHPQDRAQLSVSWSLGNLSAAVFGNHVSDQDNPSWEEGWYDEHLASFTTWDVQASYVTPWDGVFTVGARNVLDRKPPRYNNGFYDYWQHEIYGRVPYLRLEQSF